MRNPIKCVVVDDEPLAVKLMAKHIGQLPQLSLVGQYTNPLEVISFLKHNPVDLLFLDIQMPVLTGIDFVKSMPKIPAVIFTTAYRDYAVESYELDTVDYLLKPITFPRFLKAVQKYEATRKPLTAIAQPLPTLKAPEQDWIYINVNKKHIKVSFPDIRYIESIKDYVRIHTSSQSFMTKETLTDFSQKLPDYFLRIHRSFVVNEQQVTAFTAQDVEIGEVELPIGGKYKEEVQGRLG